LPKLRDAISNQRFGKSGVVMRDSSFHAIPCDMTDCHKNSYRVTAHAAASASSVSRGRQPRDQRQRRHGSAEPCNFMAALSVVAASG
jgi:hypothetical protein